MDYIRKVRCPHCKKINTVDITKELEYHEETIYKGRPEKPELDVVKMIIVSCSFCGKSFKIEL